MDTIDEQLDNAVAKVNDLSEQLAAAQESLAAVTAEKATLEAVNAELTDNLTAAKDKLASQEIALREAHAQIEQLKAESQDCRATRLCVGLRQRDAPCRSTQVPRAHRMG